MPVRAGVIVRRRCPSSHLHAAGCFWLAAACCSAVPLSPRTLALPRSNEHALEGDAYLASLSMLIVTSGAALAPRTALPSPPLPAGTSGGTFDGTAAAGVPYPWNPALHDWVVRWEDVLPLQAVLGAGSYGKVC